jgi:hypothetical protein
MNKYFSRLKNTLNTEGVVRSTGVYRKGDTFVSVGDSIELTEDMCLLDPLRNSPLKIYVARADKVKLVNARKINVSKFPLRLNHMEKDVNTHNGTVLLLGRSGTGTDIAVATHACRYVEELLFILFNFTQEKLCAYATACRRIDSMQEHYVAVLFRSSLCAAAVDSEM